MFFLVVLPVVQVTTLSYVRFCPLLTRHLFWKPRVYFGPHESSKLQSHKVSYSERTIPHMEQYGRWSLPIAKGLKRGLGKQWFIPNTVGDLMSAVFRQILGCLQHVSICWRHLQGHEFGVRGTISFWDSDADSFSAFKSHTQGSSKTGQKHLWVKSAPKLDHKLDYKISIQIGY